jgi:hypothetical protein
LATASQTWKNILKALPVIVHWLSWSPGSGQAILLGRDLILGLGRHSLLSPELLCVLKQRNITFLFQARGEVCTAYLDSYWKYSGELGLSGDLENEWDCYCSYLSGVGIQLQDREDELKWSGGDKLGELTVKNVYRDVAEINWQQTIGGWRKSIWNWNLALKIKLFTWLTLVINFFLALFFFSNIYFY